MAFEIENGVLVKYTEEEGVTEVVIPEGVTKIGDEAFADCAKLRKVTIPESVTEIGEYAFMNCSLLAEVIIPNSVKKIGGGAFAYCSNIDSIEFPDNIEELPAVEGFFDIKGVFHEGALYTVKLPKNLKILGTNSFEGNLLETVELPEGLEVIGKSAFACNSLTSVMIPDSVRKIEKDAFSGNRITSVSIGNNLEYIATYDDDDSFLGTLGDNFYWGKAMDFTKRYALSECRVHITYNVRDFENWYECGESSGYVTFGEFACCNHIISKMYPFEDLKKIELNPNGYLSIKKISVLRDDVYLDFVSYDDYLDEGERDEDDHTYYYRCFSRTFFSVMSFFDSASEAEKIFDDTHFYNNEKMIFSIFGTLFYTESETFSDYLKENLDEAKKYLSDTNNTAAAEKLRAMGYEV